MRLQQAAGMQERQLQQGNLLLPQLKQQQQLLQRWRWCGAAAQRQPRRVVAAAAAAAPTPLLSSPMRAAFLAAWPPQQLRPAAASYLGLAQRTQPAPAAAAGLRRPRARWLQLCAAAASSSGAASSGSGSSSSGGGSGGGSSGAAGGAAGPATASTGPPGNGDGDGDGPSRRRPAGSGGGGGSGPLAWLSSRLGLGGGGGKPAASGRQRQRDRQRRQQQQQQQGGGFAGSGPVRLAVNLLVLFLLMRLWPIGGAAGRAALGDGGAAAAAEQLVVAVPFSEFVRRVKRDDVASVAVDGLHVTFSLRPSSQGLPPGSAFGGAGASPAAAGAAAGSSSTMGADAATPTATAGAAAAAAAGGGGRAATALTLTTVRPADYAVPYAKLERHGVTFSAVDSSRAGRRGNALLTALMYAFYAALLLSAFSRLPLRLPTSRFAGRKHRGGGGGGGFGGGAFGGSTADGVSGPGAVTFADVAGVDEAKEELQEIVEYLRAPERFARLGARPPSGVLLVGPPGTGKTLLARAVAGEADCPFFSISASEFVELYVGMGAMRVRELFAAARKEAPAIVFIDEIDAVAKGRDMRLRSVGNDEREQTLNQLLTELDGFDSGGAKSAADNNSSNNGADGGAGDQSGVVICIAATNRADVLDPALLRPGRFDRRVAVERPDKVGRAQILRVHLARRGLPLAADVSVDDLAAATTGFTGADLANLVNEAALLAGRTSRTTVGREQFDAAVLRSVAGIEKKRSILVGLEKQVVARHEVGHALVSTAVSQLLPAHAQNAVQKLSIIPRTGGSLGFTFIPAGEDRALMFAPEVRGQLAMLMGGRAAEQMTSGSAGASTGAADDIRRATDLAVRSVSDYGLSAAVGPLNVGVLAAGGADGDGGGWFVRGDGGGGDMARVVEREVRSLIAGALASAAAVVAANRGVHEALSDLLVKQERLEGEQLALWLKHVVVPDTLRAYVVDGALPGAEELAAFSAAAPPLALDGVLGLLREAAALDGGFGGSSGGNGGGGDLLPAPAAAAAAIALDGGSGGGGGGALPPAGPGEGEPRGWPRWQQQE